MAASRRHWQLAGLIVVTLSCMACNPLLLPYFINGFEPKHEPEFKIALEDKKETAKVVVFVSSPLEVRRELLNADQELLSLFTKALDEGCKTNKQNVQLATPSKVQKFKDDHPNWQSLGLVELGKRLEADFVIDLEIAHLSLYESGSQNTLFMGRAEISVTVAQVDKPDDGPVFKKEYVTEYPRSGSRPVSDTSPLVFRRAFMTRVANDLAWMFTTHTSTQKYQVE